MTQPTTRSFAAGHFELQIDGSKTTSYLKNCSGGWAKAGAIEDSVGSHTTRIKHLGPVEIDPLSIEIGLSGSMPLLEWIRRRGIARQAAATARSPTPTSTSTRPSSTSST